MTTTSTPTNFFNRAPRSECQGKRGSQQTNRRAFDPIAYAAAIEVLG